MKKIYVILIVCLFALNINAQQDPQYTQYMYNMNVINPAYAGTTEGLLLVSYIEVNGLDLMVVLKHLLFQDMLQ